MCKHDDPNQLKTLVHQVISDTRSMVLTLPPAAQGSRRKRLWELDSHAHCPVIGVCLPITTLRRLTNKVLGGRSMADDYELHCGVMAECKLRTPIAQTIQRELDRRYMTSLRQAAQAKTSETLSAWWEQALGSQDVAGPLWATLTHARCTAVLSMRVLGAVHMLQHQAGMAVRVDLNRFEALIDENAVLSRELAAAQQRTARQSIEHARRQDEQQARIVQLRAQLISRDTTIAQLREETQQLEAAVPGLRSRFQLARQTQDQLKRIQCLESSLLQAQQAAERQRRIAEELIAERAKTLPSPEGCATEITTRLDDHAILCVGGRPAAIPLYRHLVERTGGKFLHHDGGEKDSSAKLDATLAAADLVICQTGCISHNAYWRVKDHCKRTGKRCVFVETPSTAGLKRALVALAPAIQEQALANQEPL